MILLAHARRQIILLSQVPLLVRRSKWTERNNLSYARLYTEMDKERYYWNKLAYAHTDGSEGSKPKEGEYTQKNG